MERDDDLESKDDKSATNEELKEKMGELTPVQPADAIQFYPDFDEQDDELAFDRTLNDSDNAQVLKQPGQNQNDLLDTTK